MANQKISQLNSIVTIDSAADFLAIVDTSATETKKVTPDALKAAMIPALTSTYVAFGSASNLLTGDSTLAYSVAAGLTVTNKVTVATATTKWIFTQYTAAATFMAIYPNVVPGDNNFVITSDGDFATINAPSTAGGALSLRVGNTTYIRANLSSNGSLTFEKKCFVNGTTTPTAYLHVAAGTGSASTAPIKLTSGTVNATAEAGAMEYNNTFHLTNSDATRRHIVLAPNTTKVTAGAPYTNDGYVVVNIGGTDFKFMTTA